MPYIVASSCRNVSMARNVSLASFHSVAPEKLIFVLFYFATEKLISRYVNPSSVSSLLLSFPPTWAVFK